MATLTVEKEECVLRGYVPLEKIQVKPQHPSLPFIRSCSLLVFIAVCSKHGLLSKGNSCLSHTKVNGMSVGQDLNAEKGHITLAVQASAQGSPERISSGLK